jgi:16S rRNA processing protein RimM
MALTEIIVGVIIRPHGIRGEVVVDLRTDEPERRFRAGEVLRPEQGSGTHRPAPDATFTVARTREHQRHLLVTFDEITDRNAAEAAKGVRLVAEVPDDERPTGDDEYFDRQLIGLSAIHQGSDELIGTVTAVLHLPAQDVLEIRTDSGQQLVPFVSDLVPEVDLDRQRVVVADLAGLLSQPAEDEES